MMDKLEQFCLGILRKMKLQKIAELYETHKEGMRYLIFGVLTTLLNILVSNVLYYLLLTELAEALRVNLSTIMAIFVAWVFAYVTNKIYVFDAKCKNGRELIKEIFSFIGCRTVTAVVEIFLMDWLVTKCQLNFGWMKILVSILIIVLNFVFSKLIIFKKGEKNG